MEILRIYEDEIIDDQVPAFAIKEIFLMFDTKKRKSSLRKLDSEKIILSLVDINQFFRLIYEKAQ